MIIRLQRNSKPDGKHRYQLKLNIIVLQVNMMMFPVGNILLHLRAGDAAIFPIP